MLLKTFLLKIKDLKILNFLIAIIVALPVSYLMIWVDLMPVKHWLSWIFGMGVLGILLLHVRSFFTSDVNDLGFYYSRLYGMFFGFICTGAIFLVILGLGGKAVNPSSLYMLLVTVLALGFFNFLRDNYADMAVQHLLAKNLLEKNKNK